MLAKQKHRIAASEYVDSVCLGCHSSLGALNHPSLAWPTRDRAQHADKV